MPESTKPGKTQVIGVLLMVAFFFMHVSEIAQNIQRISDSLATAPAIKQLPQPTIRIPLVTVTNVPTHAAVNGSLTGTNFQVTRKALRERTKVETLSGPI